MLGYRFLSDRKAFVFTLEMLLAIMLAASFMGLMSVSSVNEESVYSANELKEEIAGALVALDKNGTLLEVLDDNSLDSGEKGTLIHNAIVGALGENVKVRSKIKQYDLQASECRAERDFENCFTESVSFAEKGDALPSAEGVVNEKVFLVKRQPPAQCEVSEEKLSLQEIFGVVGGSEILFSESEGLELLFDYEEGLELFFEGEDDLNVEFGVKANPSDELECDEQVKVDLNMSIQSYGRVPADVVLVMDRSGSMGEFEVPYMVLGSGSFNDGTVKCVRRWYWWCLEWQRSGWQTLTTFKWAEDLDFEVRMYYSGYSGSERPRLRLVPPSGGYEPYEDGASRSSPISIEIDGSDVELGIWKVQGWSDDLIDYDLNLYITKMDAAKKAAKNFVDLAEWEEEDFTGLVSYHTSASLDQELTDDRDLIKSEIDALIIGSYTNTGDGIYVASDELTGSHSREEAKPFQVLLSDGQSNTGPDPVTAAQAAAAQGIVIYTIGFGEDVDEAELTDIAEAAGGEYYYAEDMDALNEVYEWIAIQIGASLEASPVELFDVNIVIPLPSGIEVLSSGGGSLVIGDGNFLVYDIGYFSSGDAWIDYFKASFPCDSEFACDSSERTFPSAGTVLEYLDENGVSGQVDWNAFNVVDFRYRDLTVDVLNAEILSEDQIFLDVRARNSGWLDSKETELDFYLEDPLTGTLLTQEDVSSFCGELTGCANWFENFYNVEVDSSGYIYAIINRDREIRECTNNNVVRLYCTNAPTSQYYSINVWAWN